MGPRSLLSSSRTSFSSSKFARRAECCPRPVSSIPGSARRESLPSRYLYPPSSIARVQHPERYEYPAHHPKIVTVLLDFGAQANFDLGKRAQGTVPQSAQNLWHGKGVDCPPLFTVVEFGNLELVKLLLQRGADPELYAPSSLYHAIQDDQRGIILILLEHGVGRQAKVLKLALLRVGRHTARMKGDHEMVELLESHRATLDALADIDGEDWDGIHRPIF